MVEMLVHYSSKDWTSFLLYFHSCFLKRESVSKLSTSPNIDQYCKGSTTGRLSPVEYLYRSGKDISGSDDLNDEKGITFSIQRQLTEKQKPSSIENKKGAEKDSNDSAIMAYINKNYKKIEKLDESPGQVGSQNQTSTGSSPDLIKEKDEPKTFITGRRMTKSKVLGDLSQPASSNVAQNRAQVSNKKIRMDINGKGHRSSPENFPKQMKKTVYANPPSVHLNQTVKNWRRESNSALPNHEKSPVEQKEFLMAATSVGNLTKMNSQTPLSHVEKKWHSAEMLNAGVSRTATDILGNWQEDDENEISDTDSSYSVDSLSCAYAKAFPEKLKQEDFDRNKCLANPEDSESDDSQMSQDSLVEKENKAKKQNTSQFHKLKAHHEPAKLYKSRTENHISSLVASYASRRRLGKAERSFSLDSLADEEEMPTDDLVEESKSDSSDEVPAEIFWKLQTPKLPAIQIEEDHESKTCDRDKEGTNCDLKLSSSFYLNTNPQTASSNACKQLLKGTKVSFAEQERSPERRLYYTSGNPLLTNDGWFSCDSKVDILSPRITSSHENMEIQDAHLCSLSEPELWLKKDDLKQSAAEVSFVSGSKQIHSITHSPHHVNQINSVFSSDTLEVPLPETTTASGASESGSLNKISEGWTNSNENSSLESQNIMSSFVSSVGPSASFVPASAEHDYYEHSRSHHPEQEQLGELSTYRSATERAQTFSCLGSTSTADCLSLVSKKEENSFPTTNRELPEDHTLKKTPFISVLPVQIAEQRKGCVDPDLEDYFFQTFSKDELDSDYNNLMTKSCVTDSDSGSASVSAPAGECSMGFAHNMTSTQTSAVKHIQFGNCGQLFPVQKTSTCCDEGFFLSDLTNKNCSLVSSYKLQTLAGQGAESGDTEELPRSEESNLETMQETDHEQIPAEVAAEADFSSQKTTYQCHPLVVAARASHDQSATPVEMSQKERSSMEISTDSLADIVPEMPSFRDHEEYVSKDEDLSSVNHYEFKHKPDSKDCSPECALADNRASCLSQEISENSTLCSDNIREESSESKEHNVLNSQAVVQKEFSSKYENLVVNDVSYFLLNVNGKNTKSFPAAICENTNDFFPESNSSIFYKISTKANLFQSASETKNYDKLLEHVTIVKGDCDATSNLTVEVSVTESCSGVHSGCLCTTCSSKSTGQKNTTHNTADISAEFDATVLLETETQNKYLLESRKENEAVFESDCPEDIFHVEHDANSELERVFECNTNASAAISQEESSYTNKESKFFRNVETDTEEAMVPYQNTGTARDEEIIKSINNASNLEKSALEIKSRHTGSLPDSPAAQVQSVTEDRSGKDFKDIGLSQNPKKHTDIAACEVHCEFNTNLCLTHEEVGKEELQEAGTRAEHTQESKALVHSGSQLDTSSFCQKEKSEKIEISIYSPELSVAPRTTPSAVCSHTTEIIWNTLGLLDTCKGLLQINRTTENVAETALIPRRQGNISEKLENEGKINSNNLIEHCVPNCLPQEDKVNECEVTGSEEQISMTNIEELVIMRQEDICTDENGFFNEQSPALHQMYCDRDDEEILNQFKIPERYLMSSELEQNILLEDDSRYHDPTEVSEDGDSVDSTTEIGNGVHACEYSVDDSADIDQYRTKQKFTSLDRHMYMSCSVQSPEHGTSENLNVGIVRKRPDICELDQVDSRAEGEKVQLMKLVEMAKADKQKQMFVENTEEVELIFLQNLDELFPENQMTRDDSRLNEILRESQWMSTSFSRNNEDISKQQNPPVTLKCTEKNQDLQDSPCQSVNHPLYLGGSDDSHFVQDVPTALKGCTKSSNSSLGTGAVLPYYETLLESETGVGTSVTANKMGEDEHLPDKTQSKSGALLQTKTTQKRQEEESFVFKNGPDYAISAQSANENSSFTPYSAGGLLSGTVVLQQRVKGNSFLLEKLDSSEDIIQDIDNSYEEQSMDLMVNKLLKDCLNSIEDTAQEAKDIIVPDSLVLDNSNLVSPSEKEVMEDIGVGKNYSLLENPTQKIFQNINKTQKIPHSGGSSLHDEKTFLSASYPTANSKSENAEFPGLAGYQKEPTENQEHEASNKCYVDQPGNTLSEKASALSEGLNKSPKENPHYSKDFLNYNRNLGTSECSPGLLNCPASSADSLIISNGDKGKNDTVLSEETKYFESESTDSSVSVTFPGVSQKGDGKENNSAVAEATYAQSNKLPEKIVATEQKEKIVQGYFHNCGDIKEDKIPEFSEHFSNTNNVTVPESGLLTFQSEGSNESKSLPSYSAEDTPPDTPFQSSKTFSDLNTSSLLGDSKSLVFSQLDDSLQDSCLTEKVSCNSADVCSLKEGDFPQTFARVNYPGLTAFSESPLTADSGHGETSTYDTSHSNISKQSPFAVLQIQDTQSDKAVVFDEPVCTSGSILLSLAKENKHCPVSDIDCTSCENSAVEGEPEYGSNSKKTDSDRKINQRHWDKVPPQEACNKQIEKIPNDNSLSVPSLPFWDTRRAIIIKEGQMRNTHNRSKEELHSNIETEHFTVKTEQRKTLGREPAEKQTSVSSNSPNELIGSEIRMLENLYPRDVLVDPEYTCNSFSPAYPTYRSTDPRQSYHTVLGFERNPADLQDDCQYVPTGEQIEQVPDRTNTDGRKEILLCKNNICSNIDSPAADAEADTYSTLGDTVMRNNTLKSERPNFSEKNNETTSIKFLPENHDSTPQESKLVQFRSKKSYSTTRSTKGSKQSELRPYLQSHRVSAPAIAVFSDTEYTLESSCKADPSLYSASKSLQDLNMSVEPPSPTEDDLYGIERFSKQKSKNFLQVKSKPRFQKKMAQTKKLANCDPKNLQNFAARSQSSHSLEDCTSQSSSSLLPTAHSSVCAEGNVHSKSSSVAQCSEGKGEEAGYQPETDLFLQDRKDAMHFRSSDINPYIHPWQQDGACKIGWKHYVFGSASDVSCNQIPLNMENRKVMRCSSVDNGLNSQNSPFRSHLSSYATAKVLSSTLSSIEGLQEWDNVTQDFQSAYSSDSTKQYSNISSETLETNSENNTAEFENPAAQPGNSSMQVDEIVLLYPSESEKPSRKPSGITCERGTQTATMGRYKRQRRHQRSYTDVSARKEETNRDLFHQPSSWTSMQNLSMHLSQLLQNTSELLGNLSQQSTLDNDQNAKIDQKGTEGAVKAIRSDSCTQTTTDVGTQTEILEEPQSKHQEKQVEAKMEKELRAAQAVNVDWKEIGADRVGEIPKRKEETPSLEERTQEQTEMKNLGNSDFHDSLDSILEDSFMHLPLLPKTPILHFQKTLNAQQNVAFASTRVLPLTSSLPGSGQGGSSCTVVSSPTNSTSQSPTSYTQNERSVNETETPAERKFWYKNTLLVDRASSPILTLSASHSSQTAKARKSVCPSKEPLGYSSIASSPLHNQRKLRAGPQFSVQHHVDNFSQTETDSESSSSREHRSIRKKSGTFSDKKAAKELLGQDGSNGLEQQHRLRVDTHTTICAERLYHSSSMLEVSGHSEVVTGDVRDQGSVAHSIHCMYVTRDGRGSSGGIGHEKYTGNSDTALIRNYPSPNADLFFNKKISATCSSKTNAGTSSEPLVEASSLKFHDFFWKNENSCPPPLSDVSDLKTSFRDDSTDSVTGSECDTEIPLSKSTTFAKPYRPRSYSLRDLPIHNKFSNWCGVKSSPPPLLLGLSGSVTDLRSQAEKKPRSTRSTEMEENYQSCDSRSREIKRLQRERAQIMSGIHLDLHQHPLTVELAEAKLSYGIGETDALLRVLQRGTADEPVAIPVKQQLYER